MLFTGRTSSALHSALVLTAGLGTRLSPLTDFVAKPAVPLAGLTLVERVLDWLRSQQIAHVVLNLHHRPETITAVLGDGAHLGMRVRYSWEQPLLGSAGGPRHALPLIDGDPFAIVNGDTLSAVDLHAMLEAFDRLDAEVLMAVMPNPAPRQYSGIAIDDDGRVVGFVPRGDAAAESWHFVGVQIVRRSVFASLPDGVPAESVSRVYRTMMSERRAVFGWPVETPFLDVGTPRDYLQAAVALAAAERRSLVEPGAHVDRSAQLDRTIVWDGARVGAAASLTECIVPSGAAVEAGTVGRRLIITRRGSSPLE